MNLLVLKFGGTSVGNLKRIEHAAQIVCKEIRAGQGVVVVVSAMAGFTNELVDYAHSLYPAQTTCEHDVVFSAGEQITTGLFALCLKGMGLEAQSFLSWQIPIVTDTSPTNAKIQGIGIDTLMKCIEKKIIPIVPGFQGISPHNRLTTLGRGGSDTTAVALAASLKAYRCDIYTDVEGVYTADPRIVSQARRLEKISYSEIYEMAAQGAKVLQARSVELAMKHNVNLRVLSSFSEGNGTVLIPNTEPLEGSVVKAIVHNDQETRLTFVGSLLPTDIIEFCKRLAEHDIMIDMVFHDNNKLSFNTPHINTERILNIVASISFINDKSIEINSDIAKISLIGMGLKSDIKIITHFYEVLLNFNIPPLAVIISEIKICVIVPKEKMSLLLVNLHTSFNLDYSQKEAA